MSGASVVLHDAAPDRERFRSEVCEGLRRDPKQIPCKWLYDARGSALFEEICEQEEYYPTRTELALLGRHGPEIGELLGPRCLLIEYGTGSGAKARLLLGAVHEPAAYVPVDIARGALHSTASSLASLHPGLQVLPVCADFSRSHPLPAPRAAIARRVVFFPGSSIGNFGFAETEAFLGHVARVCGRGGGLLVGIDLQKPRAILERAYNDAAGVTAAFNLNLLQRINRELGADFDPAGFRHRALYEPRHARVEMHLVSQRDQRVTLDGERFELAAGETICTEHSHKYTVPGFLAQAWRAGLHLRRLFSDAQQLFAVLYLEAV